MFWSCEPPPPPPPYPDGDHVSVDTVDDLLRDFKKAIYRLRGDTATAELELAWSRAQEAGFWLKQAVAIQDVEQSIVGRK
jgi:hypothetical protein